MPRSRGVQAGILASAFAAFTLFQPLFEGTRYLGEAEVGLSSLAAHLHIGERREAKDIVIVEIDAQSFVKYFHATRPLPPEDLKVAVEAILHSGPKALGVDIDTSPSEYTKAQLPDYGIPIVWGRFATPTKLGEKGYFADRVLGRDIPSRDIPSKGAPSIDWGLTVLITEADGTVRRFRQSYPIFFPAGLTQTANSLAAKLTGIRCGDNNECRSGEYYIDFRDVSACTMSLSALYDPEYALQTRHGCSISGKTVLLGDVSSPRDEHRTPVGWKSGVEVMANVVATEAQMGTSNRFRVLNHWLILAIGLLLCVTSWKAFDIPSSVFHYCLATAGMMILAVLAGYFVYGSWGAWVFFLPGMAIPAVERIRAVTEHAEPAKDPVEELKSFADWPTE